MITIHKYSLNTDQTQKVEMPRGAQLLSVQAQDEKVMVWARVDTIYTNVQRIFHVALTGSDISSRLMGKHIGTVLLSGGGFVVHVFDGGEE